MIGCWGPGDWGCEGFGVAALLSVGVLSSGCAGASHSIRGILVVGHLY